MMKVNEPVDEDRVLESAVVYFHQKSNMGGPWQGHHIDEAVVRALLGFLPDNFNDMRVLYEKHVESLCPDELDEWQRWLDLLMKDLRIVLSNLQMVDGHPFLGDHPIVHHWGGTGLYLEGCSRFISVTR